MNTITRVTKIKDCPSFVDFRPGTDLPEFKKYNLIYGWNGSGKTSFSRILRSFELGQNYFMHPRRSPEFEFRLKNGNSIDQNDLTVFPHIRVFNKDFINENIFGTDGPKPIFFLGKESKEDKEKISKIEIELKDLKKDQASKKTLLDKARTNKDRILSEKARDIKNTLTTSRLDKYRNYERPSLEEVINSKSEELKNPTNLQLDKDRLMALQKMIQQTTKPAIIPLRVPNFDISDILAEAKEILQKTAISQIIEALKSDGTLGKWVEHGLTIHKERNLEICAFCNQAIPQNRLSDLENHFNRDYQNLIEHVRLLKEKCSARKVTVYFPDASNFYEDLASEYLSKKKEVDGLIKAFNERLDSIISVLEQKERKPFSQLTLESFSEIDATSFQEIKQIIERHNKKSDNFESQLGENKHALEMHYIAEFVDTYNKFIEEIKKHESDHQSMTQTITEKEQEIHGLKENLISHHIPAQQINKDLEQFLGRSDIQLRATDEQEGYKITRNGEIAKDLSEGEKTALAIVYFLTKINEEGFDIKDSVVVIDDPVSSLDSSSIFQAFGFIKESIKGAGQILIFTHHFDFFRQVKNWFSHCNKNDREYFMVVCREEDSTRKSSIIKIDKLLIDYESEYHFLFSVLYKFAKEQERHLEEMYPLPNIARKFLESFLAFRVPIGSGEPSIYQRLNRIDFDSKKKERIRRFVETHSHPRYESGVQDFDMTILGETPDILNDLLELVEYEDKKHYDFLVESVTTNNPTHHSI
ncbi:MAG: AAA family ATPase [Candidatus Brocadiales bacterium]|nr:AAA family ATPase [Candidatus Brocadiales bacterium]